MNMKNKYIVAVFVGAMFLLGARSALAGSATVSWNANTESDLAGYKIYYGVGARTGTDPKTCGLCGYASSQSVGNVLTYTFNNLTDGQTYYFSVSALDTSGNESVFSTQVSKAVTSADTTAPMVAITAPAPAATVSGSAVTVTASASDNVGVVGVQFLLDGANLGAEDVTAPYAITWNTTLTTNAAHALTARARDAAGNQATSAAVSVTVNNDTTAPVISLIASSSITQTAATIAWTTNEASDTQVEYGQTTAYGSLTALNSSLVTSHSVTLSGLSSGTLYHYRVASRDAAGNLAQSSDFTFTTTAPLTPDIIAPSVVSDLTPQNITQTSVDLVTWTAPGDDGNTGTAAGYDLRYSSTITISSANFSTGSSATGLPTPLPAGSRQSYSLVGLTPGTAYTAALKTADEVPNWSGISNIVSFTTLASAPTSPPGGGGGGGGGSVSDTTPPPAVTNFHAQPLDSQVSLSWTNPTNSQDWVRTIIVRKAGSTPPASVDDGSRIYEGTGSSFVDTNLTNSSAYTYAAFTLDRTPNYSAAVTGTATPAAGLTQVSPVNPPVSTPATSALSGRLIKYPNSPTVYLLQNGTRYPLSSWGIYLSNFRGVPIAILNETEVYPDGEPLKYGSGTLLKAQGNPAVFLILSDLTRYGFTTSEEFFRFGYHWDLVEEVTQTELDRYILSTVTRLSYHPTNTFIKYPGDPTVYRMQASQRRGITSWPLYRTYADPKYILTVPRADFTYPDGPLLSYPDGSIIRAESNPTVYLIQSNKRQGIRSAQAFQRLGYQFNQVTTVPDTDMALHELGEEIE